MHDTDTDFRRRGLWPQIVCWNGHNAGMGPLLLSKMLRRMNQYGHKRCATTSRPAASNITEVKNKGWQILRKSRSWCSVGVQGYIKRWITSRRHITGAIYIAIYSYPRSLERAIANCKIIGVTRLLRNTCSCSRSSRLAELFMLHFCKWFCKIM